MHRKLILLICAVAATYLPAQAQVTDLLNEYLLVNSQLRAIYQKIQVGQVVAQVNTRQLAKFDEVITERYREKISYGSSWSAHYGFNYAGGGANYSHSSGHDTSKIIAGNPQATAEFSSEERRDFAKLQKQLQSYIGKNEGAIIQMLLLGARASYLAYQLEQAGLSLREDEITDTVEMVSNVYFLGVQNVTRCVQINFAGGSDYSRSSSSSGYSAHAGIWAHVAGSSHYSHSTSLERVSHSVKTCSADENWAKVDAKNSTQYISLQFLSSLMREWVGALSRSRVISKPVPTFNLTWNSPFFK